MTLKSIIDFRNYAVVFLATLFSGTAFAGDVCDRAPMVRLLIESALQKDCEFISSNDLQNVTTLSFPDFLNPNKKPFLSLLEGDFEGLNHLRNLWINSYHLVSPFNAHLLKDLVSLRYLRLNDTDISSFPAGFFSSLQSLEFLELVHNQINQIDVSTFSGLTQLKVIMLGWNRISYLDPSTFNGLSNLKTLHLVGNPLMPENVADLKTALGPSVEVLFN